MADWVLKETGRFWRTWQPNKFSVELRARAVVTLYRLYSPHNFPPYLKSLWQKALLTEKPFTEEKIVYSGPRYEIRDSFLIIGQSSHDPVKLATAMPDNYQHVSPVHFIRRFFLRFLLLVVRLVVFKSQFLVARVFSRVRFASRGHSVLEMFCCFTELSEMISFVKIYVFFNVAIRRHLDCNQAIVCPHGSKFVTINSNIMKLNLKGNKSTFLNIFARWQNEKFCPRFQKWT